MKKIDWHSGFVSAMKLELVENENDLIFDEEHPLAHRAQRIDLLIIKNITDAVIRNPIGRMFARYNICEYKSPDDSLTYGDFFKVLAYTGLYIYETQKDGFLAKEYTMTFIRESHPIKLLKQLINTGIEINKISPGIYALSGNLPFRTQLIITKEIPDDQRSWLKCLTKHGTANDLRNIVTTTPLLPPHHKAHADNVMSVFTSANKALVAEEIKEKPIMCKAVDELFAEVFADQIKEKDDKIATMKSQLADKDSLLADKDAIIAKLQAQLEAYAKKELS